ncbi:MAG: hypothetical protein MUF53_00295 [Gemmatimonadaceae bacterium]|jgi:hypothetical protein|nr:hypothetical protein [Gemmatimonadaceae bacterium]
MRITTLVRRALAGAAIATLAACEHDHEDITVASARVEVLNSGGAVMQTVTVTPNNVTGGPLQLTRGVAATVRVTWLDGSGASDPANNDSDFEVRFSPPAGSGLSFALNSGSRTTGVMTGSTVQASAVQVGVQLYHTGENHSDFDARVPVTVVNPPT